MERSAEGKVAVVTGANRGMGLESCRQLARRGARVVLTGRDRARGEAAAELLRTEDLDVGFHQLDVTDDTGTERLADFLARTFGRLDVLINNAAVVRGGDESRERAARTFEASPSGFRQVLATNLVGPFLLCQALIPLMQGSGRVVNVSSGLGQLSDMGSGFPAYRVSKAGLNALTRIFASEVRGTNVKVNAVCPGWVRTEMGRSERLALDRARRGDHDLARDPAGRRSERRPLQGPTADTLVTPPGEALRQARAGQSKDGPA